MLATGSFDASVGIWRHYDDDMNPKPAGKDVITGVDFDARDRAIENGKMGGEGEEEDDDEEWRFAIVLDGHDSEVKSVAWSSGGNLLATCSRDKSVWIWEEVGDDDYETVAVMQDHAGDVKCVAWHPEEELVASASYDDEVRLWREDVDDWGCCAVLKGHEGTVWCVGWESVGVRVFGGDAGADERRREEWFKRRETSGPRLLSCSDDGSIRVWRRRPKEKVMQSRLSIIRSGSSEEDWVEEARLPRMHSRPIYAVGWGRSGRVVSTGGDGAVVVYEERWRSQGADKEGESGNTEVREDGVGGQRVDGEARADDGSERMEGVRKDTTSTAEADGPQEKQSEAEGIAEATEWVAIAQIEGAHGVFEVNHVAWAPRRDRRTGGNVEEEELIVTTGDDGKVRVWRLDVS